MITLSTNLLLLFYHVFLIHSYIGRQGNENGHLIALGLVSRPPQCLWVQYNPTRHTHIYIVPQIIRAEIITEHFPFTVSQTRCLRWSPQSFLFKQLLRVSTGLFQLRVRCWKVIMLESMRQNKQSANDLLRETLPGVVENAQCFAGMRISVVCCLINNSIAGYRYQLNIETRGRRYGLSKGSYSLSNYSMSSINHKLLVISDRIRSLGKKCSNQFMTAIDLNTQSGMDGWFLIAIVIHTIWRETISE